jgi:predicted lipoprotein with Yx(FWY)xxD motif
MHRSRSIPLFGGAGAIALSALVLAACGGGGGGGTGYGTPASAGTKPVTAAQPDAGTVRAATTKLGRILVDSQGRSVYLFENDIGTASTCYGACASIWPPLTVSGSPEPGAGIVRTKLGTTKRTDGKTEVTYGGHPLYYYAGDQKPGDTTGQGLNQFGAPWDVLSTTGKGIDNG